MLFQKWDRFRRPIAGFTSCLMLLGTLSGFSSFEVSADGEDNLLSSTVSAGDVSGGDYYYDQRSGWSDYDGILYKDGEPSTRAIVKVMYSDISLGEGAFYIDGQNIDWANTDKTDTDSVTINGKTIECGKYLLSTKELNTSKYVDRLLESSIYSFKIEGRMKSPLYVGFITRLYRRLIDKEEFDLSKEIDNLKTIFNREFTKGRLFGEEDNNFMNTKSPNHVGLEIGKVVGVTSKKVKIKLNKNQVLNQYDAIRFMNSGEGCIVNYLYDKTDNLINSSDYICYIDNKYHILEDDVVFKTQDYLLGREFNCVKEKKIPINFDISLFAGEAICLNISDGENKISITGDVVQKALNAPIDDDSIERQLKRLGGTPFVCSEIVVRKNDNIFVPLKRLNEIRREAVDKLKFIRENKSKDVIVNNVL